MELEGPEVITTEKLKRMMTNVLIIRRIRCALIQYPKIQCKCDLFCPSDKLAIAKDWLHYKYGYQ